MQARKILVDLEREYLVCRDTVVQQLRKKAARGELDIDAALEKVMADDGGKDESAGKKRKRQDVLESSSEEEEDSEEEDAKAKAKAGKGSKFNYETGANARRIQRAKKTGEKAKANAALEAIARGERMCATNTRSCGLYVLL
jgi:hypothetical protein